MLLTPEDGGFEVYAYLNRAGGYGSLLTAHPDPAAAATHLEAVTRALARAGADMSRPWCRSPTRRP